MIGACADWFAVVALFRHPLGIADSAYGDRAAQQGAYRRRHRPLHFQQLPVAQGPDAQRSARSIRSGGRRVGCSIPGKCQPRRAARHDVAAADPAGAAARRPQRVPGARRAKRHRSGSGCAAGLESAVGALGPGRDPGAGRARHRPCRAGPHGQPRPDQGDGDAEVLALHSQMGRRHRRRQDRERADATARRDAQSRPSLAHRAWGRGRSIDRRPCHRAGHVCARRRTQGEISRQSGCGAADQQALDRNRDAP